MLKSATPPANAAQIANAAAVQYRGTLTGNSNPAREPGAPASGGAVLSDSISVDSPSLRKA